LAIKTGIWIYWLFCAIATALVIARRDRANGLLSPHSASGQEKKGYHLTLLLGWIVTLLASGTYVLFTVKRDTGHYHFVDLAVFSVLNGILEQFMFIFWFLVGCYIGRQKFQNAPICIFMCGYASNVLYSGLIHSLFWIQVLPKHDLFIAPVFISALMSAIWVWLLWRYRAVISIIAMHIVVDFLSIGHLHFSWFESFQLFKSGLI
jgi:hypothetical protein